MTATRERTIYVHPGGTAVPVPDRLPGAPPLLTPGEEAQAFIRAQVTPHLPWARGEFLARYREMRRGLLSPFTALQYVRGAAAADWLRYVMSGFEPDPRQLAVAHVADKAIASRIGMPTYWWRA